MQIVSLNIGRPQVLVRHGRQFSSAINRRPADGPLELTPTGLAGDRVSDDRVHGGPDKALCCYPIEHYPAAAAWLNAGGRVSGDDLSPANQAGTEARPTGTEGHSNEVHPTGASAAAPTATSLALPVPAFGENLTTSGLLEREVCIGDTFDVGDAVVQVSQPRQPCGKLALKHSAPGLPGWIVETGFTGFYFRVLTPGRIRAGEALKLTDRPNPGFSIAALVRQRFAESPDRDWLERTAALPQLSAAFREQLEARLRPADGNQS